MNLGGLQESTSALAGTQPQARRNEPRATWAKCDAVVRGNRAKVPSPHRPVRQNVAMSRTTKTERKALIVYHRMPHYRRGVFARLDEHAGIAITHFSDASRAEWEGIKMLPVEAVRLHEQAKMFHIGRASWQRQVIPATLRRDYDVVIFLGDASIISTWIAAFVARLRGKRVAFWTIGWHRPEKGLKRLLRLSFYRLANDLLLYGHIAYELGVDAGYPAERMKVIYNSVRDLPESEDQNGTMNDAARPEIPTIGAVIRLNPTKQLEMLIQAASHLRRQGKEVVVRIAGEGPARAQLRRLAEDLQVEIDLPGAIYEETELADFYREIDLTVVPTAAGLTTIQSMSYGTPVISNDDPYTQVPEWEAIIPGVTGDRYRRGDVEHLAQVIETWLDRVRSPERKEIAEKCRNEVRLRWTPQSQARVIAGYIAQVGKTMDDNSR